jgi:hypothetical protein
VQAAAKKGSEKGSQLGKADKAMKATCALCKQIMLDNKQLKQHYESKHPKSPMPAELQNC